VRAAGWVERAAKWVRRKPTLATAYAVTMVAVLLAGLTAGAVWLWQRAEHDRFDAVTARDELAKEREKLARVEYGRAIQLAYQEWRDNNVSVSLALLEATRPDLRGWEWRYVHRLCHSDSLTLRGHTGSVNSAAFSPDGSRIVTASFDGTARVWDAITGAELVVLKGHAKSDVGIGSSEDPVVYSAAFSPDGSRIVTAGSDATARVWDAKTGKELLVLRGHKRELSAAVFSPDGALILTASYDGPARLWDAKTGAQRSVLREDKHGGSDAAFSPDGSRIVIFGYGGTILETRTGAKVLTLKGHYVGDYPRRGNTVAFSPDGTRIVTTAGDNTLRVRDAKTGAEQLILRGHPHEYTAAAFSPDGKSIVTSSSDDTARVWDSTTGVESVVLSHTGGVNSAVFSPDGTRVVTASGDGTARVWSAVSPAERFELGEHSCAVVSVAFSSDGTRLISGSVCDDAAKVWDTRTGQELLVLESPSGRINSAAISPDGTRAVTANTDNTARVLDAKTGTELLVLKVHSAGVNSAAFGPGGTRVLTASDDGTARVWDANSGTVLLTLRACPKSPVR
jgi:WD40 repeat protein